MPAPAHRNDPPPEDIDRLVGLFHGGDLAQVEAVGGELAQRFASSAVVWKVLGTSRLVAGRSTDAVAALQRAVSLAPKDPDLHANLGNALRGVGRLAEAEQHLQRSLKLNPQSPMALASLGNVLRQQRRPDVAINAYREALKLQPLLAGARQNLAVLEAARGEFAQAEADYRHALAAQPDLLDGWVNLATLLQDTGRVREAQDVLSQGLRSVKAGQWMLAALAITGCWILRDAQGAAQLFNAFQAQVSEADRALREFFWVSARLFDNMQREPALYPAGDFAPLYVIGESHSLVPAHAVFPWVDGPVRAQPRLVQGVKMHHLGSKALNQWQAAIRAQLESVPADAQVLFTIGEIDCRPDEGIWKAHKAGKGALAYLVKNTVAGYVEWVAANVGARKVTLQGVPEPRRSPDDAFLAMVADVNARLREACAARGWNFLDVHAATAGAQGKWHLDDFHLKPAFYANAMAFWRKR
ncbi:tetratricopeptide repeat protein [Ramlibacter albus]|uniref:Tetratricopeptide repeat protein n=1 Tax=Ramlibacter albus TaxID=2079448 RepID=A0A923M7B5_9BURK|nr:tetratricopeptide repeat protein [Ramlibacter albus]MBC5765168.1 tetratricopeptide repeat protein [Ramlibacter albus]